MRLLDLIAQGRVAVPETDDGPRLPPPASFAKELQNCPLRFVLSDDLVRMATALAFAEGDRLASCLDLVRVPAEVLWVEWLHAPQHAATQEILSLDSPEPVETVHRAGVLIKASGDGRSGTMRSFWSVPGGTAAVSPVITELNLDRSIRVSSSLADAFQGGWINVVDSKEPVIDEVLHHFRFQLEPAWSAYYRSRPLTDGQRLQILRGNVDAVAFDAPMLMAFFLLLTARDVLPRHQTDLARLNRSRIRSGKSPLLDHIEVSAPIAPPPTAHEHEESHGIHRRPPRLHHVRGHIVRRGTRVFWRCPHLRGNARFGAIRTRTVELRC